MEESTSGRGFRQVQWFDTNDERCMLYESSAAIEPKIWLGKPGACMHLTQDMVAAMLPYLQKFIETGKIDVSR